MISIFLQEGLSPLLLCSLNQFKDCVTHLLEIGADPLQRDDVDGRNSLHYASANNNVEIVGMLAQFIGRRMLNQTCKVPKVMPFAYITYSAPYIILCNSVNVLRPAIQQCTLHVPKDTSTT